MDVNIRNINMADLDAVAEIEEKCFPPNEAAKKEIIAERIRTFPENFFVAEYNGILVGFINGCTTQSSVIFDDMFHNTENHTASGHYMAVFGLDVLAEYRGRGIAALLMYEFLKHARTEGKKAVILTCKTHLIKYYEKFGFENNGVSKSVHGGETWYDMVCNL